MKNTLLILLVLMTISGVSHAQTMGEGVSCITWPDPTGRPFTCASGLTCAAYGPGDLTGICLDLRNDSMNCGAISMMCSPGSLCAQGMCTMDDPDNNPDDDPNEAGMPPILLAHSQPFKLKLMRLSMPL